MATITRWEQVFPWEDDFEDLPPDQLPLIEVEELDETTRSCETCPIEVELVAILSVN